MSFVRRFQFFPGTDVITLIEGIIIVDLAPPGTIAGVGTGTTAIVGEFTDMTFGVSVDANGVVSTNPQPTEVFSAQDMTNKVGGFDETIGDTGDTGGNGFISVRNKRFSRLILVPINLASDHGVRLFRDLPTNISATQATPIVPLQAAVVVAGREFKSSGNRIRTCAAVPFTSKGAYLSSITGAVTAFGSAQPTQTFTDASANFTTANNGLGVQPGDALVVGTIGAAAGQGANAATYRVVSVTSATQLVVQLNTGISFDWVTTASISYRLDPASDMDSGGQTVLSANGGSRVPARPLDATITSATNVAPTIVPPTPTGTSWDPLSNLTLRTHPASALTFTAAVQTPNTPTTSSLEALYTTAVGALLADATPARDVNILLFSRHSAVLRNVQKSHVLASSAVGVGRTTVLSPGLATVSEATVLGSSDPGVGANRDERVDYAWPGALTFIPETVGFNMKGADGNTYTNGQIDTHLDCWLGSLLSVLPPERNPGQATDPVPTVMGPILGFQRGALPTLGINDYIQFRAQGVVALRDDTTVGFMFQSGITTSLLGSNTKNINRRRFADFIEDSLALALADFNKDLLTDALKDSAVGEIDAFLAGLLSTNNPPAQRIAGYLIDDVSGNTQATLAQGIFVIIVKVQMLATADFITLVCQVGTTVNVTAT